MLITSSHYCYKKCMNKGFNIEDSRILWRRQENVFGCVTYSFTFMSNLGEPRFRELTYKVLLESFSSARSWDLVVYQRKQSSSVCLALSKRALMGGFGRGDG